ncbi:uncharacterized protein LOC118406650 [Branchiostoma floridae]|uniref:Uncharacterized protein LOC118406650 n=1 Tax=Branchiostoma floridae TaxID=7739 RepID=A0A9J7HNB2_BRAFL|nr:uncharacterized protein LOC118406650 [Branchiostoma floridae]XP_035662769.1 uncharacterized protein LOC118406650 [Branchiostoma floridae]
MRITNVRARTLVINLIGVVVGYSLCLLQSVDYKNASVPLHQEKIEEVQRHISSDDHVRSRRPQGLQNLGGPRKILLDCGANVASTVQLFRETYPGGTDYIIHSFELDARLAPYFASYSNHVLHCPVAVAGKDGNITAYTESAWFPDKGLVHGNDRLWGGGGIFVHDEERDDAKAGRQLGVRNVIPMVDLSKWIQENTTPEDYVIFKLDVEGAEYEILEKMIKEGTFKWIDKFYGEFHGSLPVPNWPIERRLELKSTLASLGIKQIDWAAQNKRYHDMELLQKSDVPFDAPGVAGDVYSNCSRSPGGPARLALTVQVGMNRKAAHKLVETIRAHRSNMPVTLFVYGDFVQEHPDLITKWADRYTIGIREGAPFPAGHWVLQNIKVMRMSMVSAVQRMREVGLQPAYYCPDGLSERVREIAKARELRLIQPTTSFPPTVGTLLTEDNYYQYMDVFRNPRAIRILHERISNGGILSLDSDHLDSYMISAFLMDYLYENSGFELVSLDTCLKS